MSLYSLSCVPLSKCWWYAPDMHSFPSQECKFWRRRIGLNHQGKRVMGKQGIKQLFKIFSISVRIVRRKFHIVFNKVSPSNFHVFNELSKAIAVKKIGFSSLIYHSSFCLFRMKKWKRHQQESPAFPSQFLEVVLLFHL